MHLHLLGIGGTFMGSLALLAREAGHTVTGSDHAMYPPMSTLLAARDIEVTEGFDVGQLDNGADVFIVGNVMSRGMPIIEAVLNRGLPYTSGPQWLSEHLLRDRWVLAVAGTHGKTSTSAMLAWILTAAGLAPGFLIGGVPNNTEVSARLGDSPFFVIEADEYDTAFFDKRAKFVHYRPRTLILNNLEYDHADIFPDLAAIQRQFHHLVRLTPGAGLILSNARSEALDQVLRQGCWTPVERFASETQWRAAACDADDARFRVYWEDALQGEVRWSMLGAHHADNALAAIAAARHVGVPPALACDALADFQGVKRRMERLGEVGGVTVYDDFAHHPSAIAATLAGLRRRVGAARIIVALEPRSNTMRMGVHRGKLAPAWSLADVVNVYLPADLGWDLSQDLSVSKAPVNMASDRQALLAQLLAQARPGDHVVLMSNGDFGGLPQQLLAGLAGGAAAQ